MEARLYAEDPYRNFLPSIGYLEKYIEPDNGNINPEIEVKNKSQ
jgi:propionyl-CoA carboxylase alpha chain